MGEIPVDEEDMDISEEIIKEYKEEVSRKTIGVDIGLSELVSIVREKIGDKNQKED